MLFLSDEVRSLLYKMKCVNLRKLERIKTQCTTRTENIYVDCKYKNIY